MKSYILNDAFHDWNDAPTFTVNLLLVSNV